MRSGDPYLSFAVRAGLAPEGATKASHRAVRDLCKACVLGTNYGMGARTLAFRTNTSIIESEALLRTLARTYPVFTEWQSKSVDVAQLRGYMSTVFGWKLQVTGGTRPTALRNFPMQSHGAEMLRIACCLATERGVSVCAPVHDALLIEAPIDQIDEAVVTTRGVMAQAAAAVIGPAPPDVVDVREVGHPQERQTVPPDRPMFGADEGLSQMFWLLIVAVGRTMMGLRIRRTHKSLTSEALVAGTDTATKAVPLKMDSPCRGEALKVRAMTSPSSDMHLCPVQQRPTVSPPYFFRRLSQA
jgi:hypothetical protein